MLTCFVIEAPGRGWMRKKGVSYPSASWPLSGFCHVCFWRSTRELPYKISKPKAKEGRRNSEKKLSHSTPLLFVGIQPPCHSVLLRGVESGAWESSSKKGLFLNLYHQCCAWVYWREADTDWLSLLQTSKTYTKKGTWRTGRKDYRPYNLDMLLAVWYQALFTSHHQILPAIWCTKDSTLLPLQNMHWPCPSSSIELLKLLKFTALTSDFQSSLDVKQHSVLYFAPDGKTAFMDIPPHWSVTWVFGRRRSHKLSSWSIHSLQWRDQWFILKRTLENSYLTVFCCSRHFLLSCPSKDK